MSRGVDAIGTDRVASDRGPWFSPGIKVGLGVAAVLAWGLFFDQLTRVAGWILDTYNVLITPPLRDLRSWYVDAGIVQHHGAHLYGFRPGAFTYPPIAAYLFLPLRVIGWHASAIAWTVSNVALLAVLLFAVLWRYFDVDRSTAWLLSAAGLAPAAIFLLYPFRSLLFWGQLGLVLLVAVFVDLVLVPARYRGVLIGIVTAVKLLPVIFLIWLLARREVGAVIRVAVTFVALTLLAWALWPHASAQYWFHILPSGKDVDFVVNATNVSTSHGRWYFGVGRVANQSLRGLLARPPFLWPGTFPWIVLALLVLAVGVVVTYTILRRSGDRDLLAFVVLALTTVLASPVSWVHYWVFAVLCPFVAVLEWRRDRVIAAASLVLTVATCANLEDPRLSGHFLLGAQFARVAPIEVFVVRNLYVLAGIVFLTVVAVRTRRMRTAEAVQVAAVPERAQDAPAPPRV